MKAALAVSTCRADEGMPQSFEAFKLLVLSRWTLSVESFPSRYHSITPPLQIRFASSVNLLRHGSLILYVHFQVLP